MRGFSRILPAILAAALALPVAAHVTYKDLDAPPVLVTTTFGGAAMTDPCTGQPSGCQSSNAFTRFGWVKGTEPTLGDSHVLTVNAEFWKFHLSQDATVTITFTQGQAGLDPAFSLYQGLLPVAAHDDVSFDPLNPTNLSGCGAASPKDAHALPYTYLVHDGYRDTLNYSTTGGLSGGCLPVNAYFGQFDAFASWSMANAAGNWSRIKYVASVSATPFTGNDSGSHAQGNHNTAVGTGETLTIGLAGGNDYVIAAGGEACSAMSSAPCTSPRLYGTVTLTRAASTPPGEAAKAAGPMLVSAFNKATGDISIGYGPACSATDHHVVYGPLATVSTYGYAGQACGLGNSGSATFNPGAGDFFWVLVGNTSALEGSYGTRSTGSERPPASGLPGCSYAQDLSATCP